MTRVYVSAGYGNATYYTNEKHTLEELQGYVGGLIQVIELVNGKQLIINEEGKLMNLTKNNEATELALLSLSHDDFIVGNAVVLSGDALLT